MKTMTALLLFLLSPLAWAQAAPPKSGYAPVNGLTMYYEVHGEGDPVVLLHGAFMTITNNWTGWIDELSRTRQVIAIEMQGHGRTADIPRNITNENLADDVAGLLEHLKIPRADIIGYSMGGGVAMECAVRHPGKVRKVVVISSAFRREGMIKEAVEAIPKLTADDFKGSPIEAEYKKLSPTPDNFPNFVKRVLATASGGHDISAEQLQATTAPMFFIHGDADGVRLEHVAEMFRLKGGGVHGDMQPRSASRLAIVPNTTHVTLMGRSSVIVPMVNDFLDAGDARPATPRQADAGAAQSGEAPREVHYLEIVTPAVDVTCEVLAQAYGTSFGKPVPELGNARTATLEDGRRVGVRGPMRATEAPVVRPYVLVEDIAAAVKAAEAAGGKIAVPPMEIPGQGTIAIYVLGGIEHGLWQK